MANKYLDYDGLLYFWQKIKVLFVSDVTYDSSSKKIQKTKAGSTSDVVTLSTVATSGSYNDLSNKPTIPTLKNVFGKVKVGSTTVEADTTQDTLELVAGSNITLTPDATNDKVTIAATDTTYTPGTNITITGTTIATTAEVNQNAFSNVKVGSTTVAADAKTDTLELVGDSNGIVITPDATNDKVTFTLSLDNAPTLSSSKAATSGSIYNALSTKANSSDLATVATSGSYSDLSNKPTIPSAGTGSSYPTMDGTRSLGSNAGYARVDHVHPSDTSRVPTTRQVNGSALSADITINGISVPTGDLETVRDGDGYWMGASSVTDAVSLVADSLYQIDADATTSKHGLMSTSDKTKLNGIASGAEVNVQSNWTETSSSSDAYIKNKPTLGTAAAKGVVTSISADSADLPTVTAVKNYVASAVTGATAFQGTAPTSFAPTNYKAGYYWVVGTAGTYVGQTCEAGDMIFCTKNYASAYSASDFDVVQTNLDITNISNAEIDTVVAS